MTISSVAQSCLTLQPYGLQHASLPYPSATPKACSDSCPSSRWCRPATSSSVVPFSSCPQSFPASQSFLMSQFFPSSGHSNGVSAWTSVLPVNIQDWSPLGLTGLISLQAKGLSGFFSNTSSKSSNSLSLSFLFFFPASFILQLSYPYTTTGKTIALTRGTFDYQVDAIITVPLKYLVQTNLVIFIFYNFLYWPRWLTRDFSINKQNMKSYICVLIIMFLWQLS